MELLYALIGLLAGVGVGYFALSGIVKKNIEKQNEAHIKEAEKQAEVIKQEKILQAKEKFLQLKT